ncbi:MAG: hypothetical protein H6626_13280 [Pseudobdellovibrionaceae bacterium]|nr:hypothetical protein [Bdellovibrionales bacterium]USN47144.1 MAG: hypothetical protein H6626_13280 [Pseudobdellovibrionaceae bacterium]
MGQFSVSQSQEGNDVVLTFQGQIDEDANFQSASGVSGSSIILNLDGVTAINSCGIREWIKWLKELPSGASITYKNCPKVIVDQINMVAGFLPDNAKVDSFYVPYYCEESGNEKMVLFTSGKEFNGDSVNPPDSVVDDETGDEMEMDVIESKYFKFLQG